MAHSSKHSDFAPALTGLVVGTCVLFALVFGIVTLTNHKFAGEKAEASTTH